MQKITGLVGPPAWSDRRPGRTAGLVGPPAWSDRQPASPPAREPACLPACLPVCVLQCSMVAGGGPGAGRVGHGSVCKQFCKIFYICKLNAYSFTA
jgi:hypothetical protein